MSARLRSSTRASTAASESLAETIAEIKPKGGDTRKTTSARPLRHNELARLKKIAILAMLGSLTFMGGLYYLVMHDKITLYPGTIKEGALKGFNARAEFALRYQTLLYSWLVFNIIATIYVRISKMALNPLVDSTEKHVQQMKNILTNSFEQIIVSSVSQLIFVSFAGEAYTLKLIPAINIVQFLGRITFFAGYPYYRTFGVMCSFFPSTALTCYNLYKLGSYLGVY